MKTQNLILIALLYFLLCVLSHNSTASAEENYLTWGDVTSALSANKDVKKKVENLLNFEIGYSVTKIDKNAIAPTISSVKIVPSEIPADGKTLFVLIASIYNPDGIENLRVVKADLSQIGRLPNSVMGLTKKIPLSKDSSNPAGIYVLENSASKTTNSGEKEIKVSVANKKGWLTLSKANISVKK